MALTKGTPPEKQAEAEQEVVSTATETVQEAAAEVTQEEVVATDKAVTEESVADLAPAQEDPSAPKAKGTAMAVHSASDLAVVGNMANAIAELAEEGFGDLALGFGAFPMITLPGQMFESSEGHNLGAEFECIVVKKDSKTLYKGTDKEDDEKEEVVYSYDGQITTNGDTLDDVINGWKSKGWKIERKQYFDVVVQITSGPMDGKIAILSLPPTARTTFSGYVLGVKLQHRVKIHDVITKIKVGQKITKAAKPYYPWNFDCIGLVGEE